MSDQCDHTDGHERVTAHLDGMRKFLFITLAVDDEGNIHGGCHYHGDVLLTEPVTPPEVERKCRAVAELLGDAVPQIIGMVEMMEDYRANDGPENTEGVPVPAPAAEALPGGLSLKEHGKIIH